MNETHETLFGRMTRAIRKRRDMTAVIKNRKMNESEKREIIQIHCCVNTMLPMKGERTKMRIVHGG
jgi:hypothetical protein